MEDRAEGLLRWVVQDVLDVTPERALALRARLSEGRSRPAARYALVERRRLRAALSGILSGVRASPSAASLASGLEHLEHMRRAALTRSALAALDDPRFFDRPDWPRRALGLPARAPLSRLVVREAARYGVRFGALRTARFAGRWLPSPWGAVLGGLTGASFNAIEDALEARALLRDGGAVPRALPRAPRALPAQPRALPASPRALPAEGEPPKRPPSDGGAG